MNKKESSPIVLKSEMFEEKTFQQNGIEIKMTINKDGSVDLDKMMIVNYTDSNGEPAIIEIFPDVIEGKQFGTVKAQFDLVQATINFDEAVANVYLVKIKEFFKTHELISVSGISLESGFSSRYLSLIISGEKRLTKNVYSKVIPTLKKYGFK